MSNLKVVVNGVEFQEISSPLFVVYGEEDIISFMDSVFTNVDPIYPKPVDLQIFPSRTYKSLSFNGKFFAPKFNEHGKLKLA